jgi:hypothetical protein
MRNRVIGTMGGLVLAAGLLLAPLSGSAFAKAGDPGSDTGKGKACIRAQQKLAQDQQKGATAKKIAQDQKRKDKACGSSSGLPGSGGNGSTACNNQKAKEISDYQRDQQAYYAALQSGNKRATQRAKRTWERNYERNQAATRRACR